MNWDKFLEKDPGTTECGHVWGIYYFFELFREKPDETFLYIRVLVPQLVRRLGTGAKLSFWHGWIELEWAVKLPALTKVRPERERYQLITWWTTWGNAKIDCEKRGGHLVTIDSDDENEIVTELLTDSGYPHAWIGLSDNGKGKTNRKWEWVTTTNMKSTFYRKWVKNQPDALKEYYVDIRSDGTWNDWCQDPSNTDYKMPYVCEFELMKPEEDLELAKRKEVVTEPEDPEGKHPTVVIWVTPEEVRVGETFTVYLKAKDDVKLQSMWWWEKNTGIPELDKDHTARIFGTYAASSWPVTATEAGTFTLVADARDHEGHQASEGKGITEATITVMDEEATGKLTFWSAFDNHGKTDLSKYQVLIKLDGKKIFSGTPPSIEHATITTPLKNISNFKPFEIAFKNSRLTRGRNKLEISLSGVDGKHWFCWDYFKIAGPGIESTTYMPAEKHDADHREFLGVVHYPASSGSWPYGGTGQVDGVYGGQTATVIFFY
jgi:hypothetical protein